MESAAATAGAPAATAAHAPSAHSRLLIGMAGTVRNAAQRSLNAPCTLRFLASSGASHFRILGPLEVVVDGEVVAIGGPRPRALLAALLLARGEAVSRDRLVEEVWGEGAPASAAHAVQVYVSRLRDVLGAGALTTGPGPVYRLEADPEH